MASQVWFATDVGVVRKGAPNEDTYLIEHLNDGTLLAAVCDGMGGANAGEVASSIAAEAFRQVFIDRYKKGASDEKHKDDLTQAAKEANKAVFDAAVEDRSLMGMGTTLAAAYCDSRHAIIANIGDSRCYHVTEDGLKRITEDHSLVAEMIKRGELSPLEGQRHPSRNLITRALGVEPTVKCDTFATSVKPGEFLLLCSDGLHDQVSEPEIYYEIYETGKPEAACHNLVELANARGGTDNITLVLISF